MRCSDCSKEVKPVVALDIDGTLGDYHGHFISFAENYMQTRYDGVRPLYSGGENFGDWFCRYYGVPRNTYRDIKLAYRQGAQKRSMPVYDDAAELSQKLREDGVEVWITTTRPYTRLDGIDPDTRFWLMNNCILYDGLIYGDDKMDRLLNAVEVGRIAAVLDDQNDILSDALALGIQTPVLHRTRWNRAAPKLFPEVSYLDEAYEVISSLVHLWRTNNE